MKIVICLIFLASFTATSRAWFCGCDNANNDHEEYDYGYDHDYNYDHEESYNYNYNDNDYEYVGYNYESPEQLDSSYSHDSSDDESSWTDNDDGDSHFGNFAVSVSGQGSYYSGSSKISINCFLFGNEGCQTKCSLKCTLYDCTARTGCCDNSFHCDCDEVYDFGSTQLSQADFEFLEFNELWDEHFEDSLFSTKIRKRIRDDKEIEKYVLQLLRNAHVSADDILSLLKDKYPGWTDLRLVDSRKHVVKSKIIAAGRPLQYNDLNTHFDELMALMETNPMDGLEKVKYRRRIKQFLQRITSTDDLEELLHVMKISGNAKLYRMAKSILKGLGYGFEEDGDTVGQGIKAILQDISGDLDDADEDEILDVAIMNQFMPKKLSSGNTAAAATTTVSRVPPPAVDEADEFEMPDRRQQASNMVVETSRSSPPSLALPMPPPPASYFGYNMAPMFAGTQPIADYGSYVMGGTSQGPPGVVKDNAKGHSLYYLVVDENGQVSQASVVPKYPNFFPGNVPPPSSLSASTGSSSSSTIVGGGGESGSFQGGAPPTSWNGASSFAGMAPMPPHLYPFHPFPFGPPPMYPAGPPPPHMYGPPPPYAPHQPYPPPYSNGSSASSPSGPSTSACGPSGNKRIEK